MVEIVRCPKGYSCFFGEPADCPPHIACMDNSEFSVFTVSEAVEVDTKLATDANTIARLQLVKQRRFGWTAGVSFSCGYDLTQAGMLCLPAVGATWGWRF